METQEDMMDTDEDRREAMEFVTRVLANQSIAKQGTLTGTIVSEPITCKNGVICTVRTRLIDSFGFTTASALEDAATLNSWSVLGFIGFSVEAHCARRVSELSKLGYGSCC